MIQFPAVAARVTSRDAGVPVALVTPAVSAFETMLVWAFTASRSRSVVVGDAG